MVFRLLAIALALLVLHFGWQLAEPPIKNSMLEGKMREMIRDRGMRGEKELRRDVLAYAREKDIPLEERYLMINLDNSGVSIAAAYETDVNVLFYTQHYRFKAASSEDARKVLGAF